MVLLVTASVGAMSLLAVTVSRTSVHDEVLSANLTAATLAARAIEQYVAGAAAIMQEAPGRPKLNQEIRNENWGEASRVLANLLRHFVQFDYVFVQDPHGVIRARVPPASTIGQDFSSRDFFREVVRTRRLYVSGLHASTATEPPVIAVAAPVTDAGNNLTGVLVAALSLERMGQFLSGIRPEDHSRIYVVDRGGAVLAHSGGSEHARPSDMRSQPIIQAVLAGKSGTMEFRAPETDEPLLGGYVPIARLGWGVVAAKPVAVAYAPADRLGSWLIAIGLGCTLVTILLGWGLARGLAGPLLRLTEATEKLAAGDLSARVTPRSRDELAALATAFNSMAERLQRSYLELVEKTRAVEAANHDLVREVGERRRGEQEIQRLHDELEQRVVERTKQLEVANRELEAFAYTIAHDLKAPLRALEGFARALEGDYADRLDVTGGRYLAMIRASALRMSQLIDDLLRYARLERREMNLTRVTLRPLLERVCEELEEPIRRGGVSVRMDLGVEEVQAEREELREALAHLVGNAVKFSRPEGGTIAIGSRAAEDSIILSVADTGIGFDMKYHDRIFGIFERLHRPDDYPGTGVGLAIVRKIADRHGGRVWANSESGKGSTFHLALPMRGDGGVPTP
jgi:signal transduction histidine kinase